jgi:hypothetical protein
MNKNAIHLYPRNIYRVSIPCSINRRYEILIPKAGNTNLKIILEFHRDQPIHDGDHIPKVV